MRAQRKKTPSCPRCAKNTRIAACSLRSAHHGARCMEPEGRVTRCGSYRVRAVDTTAAGDTFTGYFLYGMLHGLSIPDTLRLATTASALCVGRPGAADSVPEKAEVDAAIAGERFGALFIGQEEMQ